VHAGVPFATVGHALPQVPQFIKSVFLADSQPSLALRLQSWNPGRHIPIVHIPAVHDATAFGSVHALPHDPQFCASVWRFWH
jgi:hypothetical protein